MQSPRVAATAGTVGLVLVVAGALLMWLGVRDDRPGATVIGILLLVPGLAALRVRTWIRKERVLRRVGEDLHVPEEDEDD